MTRYITGQTEYVEVPVPVPVADALKAIRAHYRLAEEALQSAIEAGRLFHVTKDFVHHYTCSTIRGSFTPELWGAVSEGSPTDEIEDEYRYVENQGWCSPYQLRAINGLVTAHATDVMRGRRRCHICAPEIPEPQPRLPRIPKGCKVQHLGWRDIGRECDGSRIAKIEITTSVRITCEDGHILDFEIGDRVILGPPVRTEVVGN